MDIIPLSLRMAVRDICAQSLILRQINEIFSGSGISIRMVPPEKVTTSQRRNQVESYYASLDWSRIKDAESFLSVVGLILSLPNVPDVDKARLRNLCASAGFATESDAVRLVDTGGGEQVRNIVFAGTGAKPEIVIEDALSNRLKIIDPGG